MIVSNTKFLNLERNNKVLTIKICNPKKKNAINEEIFTNFIKILNQVEKYDKIFIVVVTGEGDFFSSGNEFNLSNNPKSSKFEDFIHTIIDFPKILIAIVNGPAIGMACTMLTLFDIIWASEKAYFWTPFSRIGVCGEGTSTYHFPKIFGKSMANEMLYFAKRLSAKEAFDYGFVSRLLNDTELKTAWTDIDNFAKLPQHSIIATKKIILDREKEFLHEINRKEYETLQALFQTDETIQAVMNTFLKKSKL